MIFIAIPALAGTWTEDFTSGLALWEIYNFHKGAEKWDVADGVAIGEIFQIASVSLLLIKSSDNWTNYAISCRVKFNRMGEEIQQLPEVGLVLYNKKGEDSRYIFSVRSTGLGSFSKRANGIDDLVIFATKRYPSGIWIELRGEVQKNVLVFSINNDVIWTTDRLPLIIGQAGLMVANARAFFDDVIVIGGESIPNRKTSFFAVNSLRKMSIVWSGIKSIY